MKRLDRQEMINRLQEVREQRRRRIRYLQQLDCQLLRQRHLKKLTILHSNDLHGDFLAEQT